MMLAALAIAQAALVAPVFAPPLDAPIRIVTERVESVPGERRFRLETVARFAREGTGYRAEMRVAATRAEGPAALVSMADHGFAALSGRTIVMHLDAKGQITAIDDLPQLWERFVQAMAENAASRRALPPDETAALVARIVAPLRAFPDEKQRGSLASLVTTAFALDAVEAIGASAPIQLPGASPFGGPVTLAGTRRTRAVDGLIESIVAAEADVTLPAQGTAPARAAHITLDRNRRFDPASGMLAKAVETMRTTVGTGDDARATTLVTTTEITRSAAWPN